MPPDLEPDTHIHCSDCRFWLFVWSPCVSWPKPSEMLGVKPTCGFGVFFSFSSLLKLHTHRRSHTNRPKQTCHKPCERVPLPPDAYLTWTCVTAGSPICPHVFGFHSYLTAVNKQFMPFNLGNTLHPDTRWSNHLDFLSLSASSYGKENSWRSSTDNTEAHYLLRALQGSFETWKVQWGLSLADQVFSIE